MIKKLLSFASAALAYLILVTPVRAINPCPEGSGYDEICKYNASTLANIVKNGVTILLIVATIASLFFLIFGGIKWITSGGDKAKVEEARNWIVAAVVGLIITFLSFFILNFVMSLFGLPKIGEFKIPDLVSP